MIVYKDWMNNPEWAAEKQVDRFTEEHPWIDALGGILLVVMLGVWPVLILLSLIF